MRVLSAALVGIFLLAFPVTANAETMVSPQSFQRALGPDSSMLVVAASGEVVMSSGADEARIPASTMKIVTAATSLKVLGPNRVFPTIAQEGSKPTDIFLVGGGDPMLSREALSRLASEAANDLRSRNIKTVTVRADVSQFAPSSDAPGWLPEDSPTYAASVEPLAFLNSYSSDPAREVLSEFVALLRAEGLRARARGKGKVPARDNYVLASTVGEQVGDAVSMMLKVSENNIAEVLFRNVALDMGYAPTWRGGREAAMKSLAAMGISTRGQVLVDGSGLSPKNRLSPRFLSDILLASLPGGVSGLTQLRTSLAVAGVDGTLTYRFSGRASCAEGVVWAKTGSLTGVNTLAGLTRGPQGEWRAFAVLVNNWNGRFGTWSETNEAIDSVGAYARGCLDPPRR